MTASNAGRSARPVVTDRWRKAIAPVSAALLLATLSGCSTPKSRVPPLTPTPTGTYQIGKFVWYDLITDDVAAVKVFYGGLFGWEFDDIETEKDNFTLASHRGVPIAGIVYLEREDPAVSQSQWVSSVSVPDVDRAAEYVKEQGGELHWGPKDVPDRGRVAIVSDPQGALFALVRASGGDPPDQVPLPGGWLWTELWTRDLAAALSFYESLAGYTHETTDVISGDQYHLLKRDDRARAGVRQLRWEDVRPNWLPYVLVDDPATVVARVDGLGGRVVIALNEEIRGGNVALIADPSGGIFAIQKWQMDESERGGGAQ